MNISTTLPPNLLPDDASPDWMNKGDNAWQLTAATLIGMQSIPGLMILYGGAVKKKWAVNSAIMVLYAFAAVLVCWVIFGYQLSFGDRLVPFWGKPDIALDQKYLFKKACLGMLPNATMVYFKFVFAAITLILIAGALLGRMNFKAWMLFVPLWLTFSYTYGVFSIWSLNGFLSKMGIIDYSGEYVIHLSSGVAGFTAAYGVGPRLNKDRERFPPNNILVMLTGAGLLWMAVQGMITGLVCITPAAGVVQGWAAIIMGLFSGSITWFTMMVVHKNSKLLQKVDDTMAILHTHAIVGMLGGILTGIFAESRLCKLFYGAYNEYVGLFYGLHMNRSKSGFRQMGIQIIGILFVIVLNVITTSLICLFVRLFIPLRMFAEDMEIGDEAAHGEVAYAIWGQVEKLENSSSKYGSSNYDDIEASVSKKKGS
ncbi:Ammonium transporter [Quillaja saponaria]|uniref:Ammonium transporter n=1 Tax=Quillaja saponaria TaxID=32244 RepID=A0AAD7L6L7_QUISA|nr:Ammonium transporter [Quillaja saponaria]